MHICDYCWSAAFLELDCEFDLDIKPSEAAQLLGADLATHPCEEFLAFGNPCDCACVPEERQARRDRAAPVRREHNELMEQLWEDEDLIFSLSDAPKAPAPSARSLAS